MHHQRTDLLFLALISIFNFLLPHFNCFVQLAFLSTSLGPRQGPASLCPSSIQTDAVSLSITKPQDSVKNDVLGLPQL